jgi:peptide/nickel transport system permease protein
MAIMRLADIQLAFPGILMALALTAVLGPSVRNLIIALTVTGWVLYARLVRGVVLSVKEREFVESAKALGAGNSRIILRHVLPNVISPVIIVAALDLGRMILAESSLSFLGLGIQPPTPSWGSMIADGRSYLFNAWWVSTFPGLFLAATVMVIALLGDAVRDRLDPHFRY